MILGVKITTLFDSGATHSFISHECAKRLGLKICNLSHDLSVITPMGTHALTSQFCPKCMIHFSETCTSLDLICLPFQDIDIIIGIDWLTNNHALLD